MANIATVIWNGLRRHGYRSERGRIQGEDRLSEMANVRSMELCLASFRFVSSRLVARPKRLAGFGTP